MKYLKIAPVVLFSLLMVACAENNDAEDNAEQPATKIEVQTPAPPPPPPAPTPKPKPNTEVEVDLETPAGDVKIKTQK